ncbi:MAG: RNA polymerase sigma factor [Fimbriimonadales bacterium]
MNKSIPLHPDRDLPPDLQRAGARAIHIALHQLQKRYSPACHDHHEWLCDCQQEAWLAILQHAPDYPPPDPPPADPEAHFAFWLARHVYTALRRYWRQEQRYYGAVVAMVMADEVGEEQELEFADEVAQAEVLEVLDKVFCEGVLDRLSPYLDAVDWALLQGLAGGKTQVEVARALGLSQQAISKRLGAIRRLAREILQESGGDWL